MFRPHEGFANKRGSENTWWGPRWSPYGGLRDNLSQDKYGQARKKAADALGSSLDFSKITMSV